MIRKLLLFSSLLIFSSVWQAVALPSLTASSDKGVFIDGFKGFEEDVLKIKDPKLNILTRDLRSDKSAWNNSLDAVKGYVKLNADQYLPQFDSLRNINDKLFEKLSVNYASNISGKTMYDKTAIRRVLDASPTIDNLTGQAQSLYSDLSKTVVALPKTKAVRSVLAQLALTLKNIGNSINQGLNRLATPSAQPTTPTTTTQPAIPPAPFDKITNPQVWRELGLDIETAALLSADQIPYKLLKIEKSATPEQIQQAFNRINLLATRDAMGRANLMEKVFTYFMDRGMIPVQAPAPFNKITDPRVWKAFGFDVNTVPSLSAKQIFFKALGIQESATQQEITQAYADKIDAWKVKQTDPAFRGVLNFFGEILNYAKQRAKTGK